MPTRELLARVDALPPAGLYLLTARLFAEGRRDDAVRWLYVAQLRSRFRLATAPSLPPDGEPALYASLNESVGRPINEWAVGDVDGLAARMGEALDWDPAHANVFTLKEPHAAALEKVRGGLVELRASVLARKNGIRRQRLANGLENR